MGMAGHLRFLSSSRSEAFAGFLPPYRDRTEGTHYSQDFRRA